MTAERAFDRLWNAGRLAVELKARVGAEKWPDYARKQFATIGYFMCYRAMRLARISPNQAPLRGSCRVRELFISVGREKVPKTTPRQDLSDSLLAFKQLTARVRRWWRDGEVCEQMPLEAIASAADELEALARALRAKSRQHVPAGGTNGGGSVNGAGQLHNRLSNR